MGGDISVGRDIISRVTEERRREETRRTGISDIAVPMLWWTGISDVAVSDER